MDRWTAVFTTTPNFLLQKADDFFCSMSRSFGPKVKKTFRSISEECEFLFFFPTKEMFFFSSRCFNVQVECSSENPVKKYGRKTRRIQVWHLAEKLKTEGQKYFAQGLKKLRKILHIFQKKTLLIFIRVFLKWSAVITTPSEKFQQKHRKSAFNVRKCLKNHISFWRSFFMKTIVWTSGLQSQKAS